MALPDRSSVAIAVAHVHGASRTLDALIDQIDGFDRQVNLLGVAGEKRLVDLEDRRASLGECAGFTIQDAGERQHQVVRIGVGLVLDAARQ